jgi:ComF family protein
MNVLERIVALYATHVCLGCGSEGSVLCIECVASLPFSEECCYRCRIPSRLGRTCRTCRAESVLVSVNSAVPYAGLAKDMLWSLKFERAQAAASLIASRMAELYGAAVPADALIVPVPTARKRVRARGYDQAVLIARAFARQTGCIYAPLLVRLGSQEQKGAGRQQRHDQLQGAFRIKRPERVQGCRIMLVDDVLTTGATFEEAAAVMQAAGAKAVGALAFARA